MATRKTLEALEPGENETTAQPAIPPGVQADVTVKYRTPVEGSPDPRARRYSELTDLLDAANDVDTSVAPAELPVDPLSAFCAEWRNFTGYPLKVTRLQDPATRRIPGQTYNRPCFEIEYLSDTPFDPSNLTGTLQIINGNSGGIFRLWLADEAGNPVPEAILPRVAIADPPKQFNAQHERERPYSDPYGLDPSYRREPAPTPAPQRSDSEIELETLKSELFRDALRRATSPQPAPTSTGLSGVSDEDRVGLLLLNQGGLLPALMTKLTALAQTPDTITKEQSWKDRGIDAMLQIAQQNPQLVERVSGTIYAIIDRVLPNPRAPVTLAPTLQTQQHPQVNRAAAPLSAAPSTFTPDGPNPDAPDDDPDDDEEVMEIVESIFELLADTRPITADEPILIELATKYPQKLQGALSMIATVPLDSVIEWIKTQGSLYEALLNGPVTGPHYRARLAELQTFCRTPAPLQHKPTNSDELLILDNETQAQPESFNAKPEASGAS